MIITNVFVRIDLDRARACSWHSRRLLTFFGPKLRLRSIDFFGVNDSIDGAASFRKRKGRSKGGGIDIIAVFDRYLTTVRLDNIPIIAFQIFGQKALVVGVVAGSVAVVVGTSTIILRRSVVAVALQSSRMARQEVMIRIVLSLPFLGPATRFLLVLAGRIFYPVSVANALL